MNRRSELSRVSGQTLVGEWTGWRNEGKVETHGTQSLGDGPEAQPYRPGCPSDLHVEVSFEALRSTSVFTRLDFNVRCAYPIKSGISRRCDSFQVVDRPFLHLVYSHENRNNRPEDNACYKFTLSDIYPSMSQGDRKLRLPVYPDKLSRFLQNCGRWSSNASVVRPY